MLRFRGIVFGMVLVIAMASFGCASRSVTPVHFEPTPPQAR